MTETAQNIAPYKSVIMQAKDKFTHIAEQDGNHVAYRKEANFAVQTLEKNNYAMDMANNNPKSLFNAVVNIASVGLSLNPATKLAYLVPRDGGIMLDISYMGLIKIATDSGSILWAKSEVVYENDTFEYHGPATMPLHKADPFSKDRGEKVGVYCVAKTRDGEYLVETMSAAEVMEIKACSKGSHKPGSSWQTFPGEMWKKAAIKRASKTWPKTSRRLDEAINIINEHEGLDEQYLAAGNDAAPTESTEDLMPRSTSDAPPEPEEKVIEGELVTEDPAPEPATQQQAEAAPPPASGDSLTKGQLTVLNSKLRNSGKSIEEYTDHFGFSPESTPKTMINDALGWAANG